jgi:acetyl esterase/lipase
MWKTPAISLVAAVLLIAVFGCGHEDSQLVGTSPSATGARSLAQARQSHATRLVRQVRANDPAPSPPTSVLHLVRYPAKPGDLAAYVTPDPGDGKKHPAIIWIFGGFDNGIGDTAWEQAHPDNDQSARAFRQAGIITMYPSFRGGNDNPGYNEGFYGEVEDVVAAADYLAGLPYVDPKRIYLGGHSTGGTMAMLASEFTDRFRAVFAFGPVADVRGYGQENLPFDLTDSKEVALRAPISWLSYIKSPTFVLEGTEGNIDSLRELRDASRNPAVHFHEVTGFDHFRILAAVTPIVARKIVADTGPSPNIQFSNDELTGLLQR